MEHGQLQLQLLCNCGFQSPEVSCRDLLGHWTRTLRGATTQEIKLHLLLHMARGVNPDLSSKRKGMGTIGPPLWSSGHSSWLQIRRPGFDSRHYQKKNNGSGKGSTQPREYN
jgi:hypothetical protein